MNIDALELGYISESIFLGVKTAVWNRYVALPGCMIRFTRRHLFV
jgi:hypothetical protein